MSDVEQTNRPEPGLASKALFGAGVVAVGIGNFVANRGANSEGDRDPSNSPALEGDHAE